MKEHLSISVITHLVIVFNCCSKVILYIYEKGRETEISTLDLFIIIIRVKNANMCMKSSCAWRQVQIILFLFLFFISDKFY